jgi:hypothetical protein
MAASEDNGSCLGLGLVGVIIALAIAGSNCSKRAAPATDTASDSSDFALGNNDAAAAPDPPLPMDGSAVQRGAQHMKLVARLASPGTAQIYSQNCYDALAQAFDWHQLDRCGGFDAMTLRWLDVTTDVTAEELAWFQPETVAGRYLAAASAHGQLPDQADARWAGLEARVSQLPLPQVKAAVAADAPMDSVDEGADASGADGENAADDALAPADSE